nr:NACHT, LRR and PYD domains-containing protein 1 homolog [Lytechinus pictus]
MKPWDKDDYAEFEEMHTVVTMVKKDSHGEDIKENEILQGSAGKIFSAKVNGRFPPRILISAPAGRGKTTAVAKMAHDWIHKEHGSGLEDLPLLFVVKFRNTSKKTSIGEAIISQLLSDVDDLTPEGLERFIRQHQGSCHIVLDGLDEYAGISSTSNILNILRWKMFRQCRVLVTTRPHLDDFFSQGDLPRVYTKMVIEGFSRESSHDYIDKFFTSIKKPLSCKSADGLKVYLDEQPLIEELVKTPLFCLMVCHLWSEDQLQSETTTQTALLDKVNLFLMHHANARSPGLIQSPQNLTKIILKLGEVALTGLLNDSKKLVFTSRDFQRISSILHMACALGIVSKTVVSTGCLPQTSETSLTTIEFYHKLAQEHAAGKFLADETNRFMLAFKISKIDRVLRKINWNIGEYENLIRFAAGTKNSLCVRIMEKLLTNSYLSESERYRILLDCSSESGVNIGNVSSLIRRCVTAQTMILKSPTIYTAVGMRNLPIELKQKVF